MRIGITLVRAQKTHVLCLTDNQGLFFFRKTSFNEISLKCFEKQVL